LNNKSMVMVNGVGHVYQRGGKKLILIHTPKRTSMTPSDSALKRQRQTLLAAANSSIAPGQSCHDVGNKTTNIIPFGSSLVSLVVCYVFNLKTNPQQSIYFLSGPGFVLD
jgi:hypothetical protein